MPTPRALRETHLERLSKLVPADVVAIYIPAVGVGTLTNSRFYALAIALVGAALVPLFLYLDTRAASERVSVLQYVVRTLAFVTWALTISQPFAPYQVSPLATVPVALLLPIFGERLLR